MNSNIYKLIGGFLRKRMLPNVDLSINTEYFNEDGLIKQNVTIEKNDYIRLFQEDKKKKQTNIESLIDKEKDSEKQCLLKKEIELYNKLYDIIIKDIDSEDIKDIIKVYNNKDSIIERLKFIFGENLSEAFPEMYDELITIINDIKTKKTKENKEFTEVAKLIKEKKN